MSSKETSGRREKGEVRFGKQSEHEIVQDGHVVSCGMFFEAGLVFMQGHIAGIVKAIFNLPIRTKHSE